MEIRSLLESRLIGSSSCRSGFYYDSYSRSCVRNTTNRWSSWGRWLLLGLLLFGFFCALLMCLCIARRRRSKGTKPFYGTGWMAPGGNNNNNNTANADAYNQQPQQQYNQGYGSYNPPPSYPPQQQQQQQQFTGSTFNQNEGYYGAQQYPNQQYGNNVQNPPNVYNREAGGDFAPPSGPPPGKQG